MSAWNILVTEYVLLLSACCYIYHICSYMFCYSSSCPSSPPFSVHHFARSPSDTHISGGGFVTYTKSSPLEVRNDLFFTVTFREFPCLLHRLPKQINTTVISLILFGSFLVRNPLHDPSVLNDFFLGYFQSSQYLKMVSSHFCIHSDLSFTVVLYLTAKYVSSW